MRSLLLSTFAVLALAACAEPRIDRCAPRVDASLGNVASRLLHADEGSEASEVELVALGTPAGVVRWRRRDAALGVEQPAPSIVQRLLAADRKFTGHAYALRVDVPGQCPFVAVTTATEVEVPWSMLDAWRGQRAKIRVSSAFVIDDKIVGRIPQHALVFIEGPPTTIASALHVTQPES
jgi:hypothetical protein